MFVSFRLSREKSGPRLRPPRAAFGRARERIRAARRWAADDVRFRRGPGPRGAILAADGAGPARLRPRAPFEGPALRRAVLHRRHVDAHLLPPDLSRARAEGRARPLLPLRR